MTRHAPALAAILCLLLDVRAARGQEPEGPRLWAVVVGIERYDPPIPGRRGLIADGKRLARWVSETAGWKADHVLELNDSGNPRPGKVPSATSPALQPTRDNLNWAMETWLGARVKPGDVVLFAFAGRGASINKEERLLPIDYKLGDAGWSPEGWVERLIRDAKCASVLCWVDAPFLDPAAPEAPLPEAGDRLLARIARWPGSWAWMATEETSSPTGSDFAAMIRGSLGDGRRTLLASLRDLDRESAARKLRFRQLGGVPGGLSLSRELLRAPRGEGAELLVQNGHARKVVAVAVQGDGRSMVTASDDSTIRIWDLTAPRRTLIRVLPEFLNGVTALALSPDGRYVVGGDGMGEVLAWDLSAGNSGPLPLLNRGKPHDTSITALAFLPDDPTAPKGKAPSTRFVSAGQDGRCEVWEIDGRTLDHRVASPPDPAEDAVLVSAATDPAGPASFAILKRDGTLLAFDRIKVKPRPPIQVPGARPSALLVDPDGRWAAVGDEDGRVRRVDLATGKVDLDRGPLAGPIVSLKPGPDRRLIAASGAGVSLIPAEPGGAIERVVAGKADLGPLATSVDGAWLAACDATGELFAWKFAEGGRPAPVVLPRAGGGLAEFSCAAFGPASAGPMLVAGENDGGLRRWDLRKLAEAPRLAPHRGLVRRLSVSQDGRHLLQVSEDGLAQVWDLKEGRRVRTLDGYWAAGDFLPDGRLAMARHPNSGGNVVVVEAKGGRPVTGINLLTAPRSAADYNRVVASRDRRRIAASASPGRDEAAYVWDLPGGPPRVFRGHDRALTAIDFSEDGKTLLTAGEDGRINLWDLEAGGEPAPREVPLDGLGIGPVTAARFAPGPALRIIAAGLGKAGRVVKGVVFYWEDRAGLDGKARPARVLGETKGRELAVCFMAGGRFAAAAGHDGRLLAWELAEGQRPREVKVRVKPGPAGADYAHHHAESVNELLAWPLAQGPALLSGSDDSTIRCWSIVPEPQSKDSALELVATLSSAPDDALPPAPAPKPDPAPAPALAGDQGDSAWVVFTPEGVYDSSLEGERLVAFSDGRSVEPLEKYAPRLYHPLLTDDIRRGAGVPPVGVLPTAPPLLIEASEDLLSSQSEAEIRVSLGDTTLKTEDLRLYLNDAPIRTGEGFRQVAAGEFTTRVSLARGDNRLYAMAGRPAEVDARSRDLILYHSGPENPGSLHVISLGVAQYRRNGLLYPVEDARDIADFLQGHGVGSPRAPGERIVLRDSEINFDSVERAFGKVRKAVTGHPEDTVVVFLAGHADILQGPRGQPLYSLLLPEFPFPETDPPLVAFRGPAIAGKPREAPPGTYLAYQSIYRNFTRLDALQRLVIVDACQAEAVLDDPVVRLMDQLKAVDLESRQSRTNYFFASRRGEAAGEAKVLNHGLLTYVMLRGMKAPNLAAPPREVVGPGPDVGADFNRDGIITTRELHAYVDRLLPGLADTLAVASRGGQDAAPAPPVAAPAVPAPARFADPRVEASGPSFPLVSAPVGPVPAVDRRAGGGGQ